MKKLLLLLLLLFFAMNVNADNARIASQYLVGKDVYSENMASAIDIEVENLREVYNVRRLTSDEWNPNDWLDYMAQLSIDYRTWYTDDVGALYRTNLLSNSGRRYIVFTLITQGMVSASSFELSYPIDYRFRGYEISD